ncbi:MAG: bifunctional UDP-sugar hydrolase/5'-nucleotidase [Candidatus Aureabacteria bacterium]|nr:bifunctional UDP-sugar hydrolase/5'-nucleotidase [Candidatus Auribacterota bacterium]
MKIRRCIVTPLSHKVRDKPLTLPSPLWGEGKGEEGFISRRTERLRSIALSIVLLFALSACARVERYPLSILHTNDVHGHIAPERVEGWRERSGGAASLAGCVRDIRAENQKSGIPTLLLDAGDIFLGTPEGNVSRGKAMTEVMNADGYDAMAVGNHEFDLGVDILEGLAESARFPILGANVISSVTGRLPPFLKPYLIKECGPLRVGIIGVITEQTPVIVMPGRTEKIIFKDTREVVRSCVAALNEKGVNFVILLSHCGFGEDKKLASAVGGIGVIIGGHSHELVRRPVRIRSTGTLVCQAGASGQYLGRLTVDVDPKRHRAGRCRYELIALKEGCCTPDPTVKSIVERWRARAGEKFDEAVGKSLADFSSSDTGESSLGDLIADSMRAATGADIAVLNSFGIRNPLLKGAITVRDIYTMMPFDNTLYTMRLSGAQIRAILEQGLSLQLGILQISGLRVEYDPKAPAGRRVVRIDCGDKELGERAEYTVVTNSYLAQGGDSYTTFCQALNVCNTGITDVDALSNYIRARSPISSERFTPSRLIPR